MPFSLSREMALTGQAFPQGGDVQCRQIMGMSTPFLLRCIQILALTGLNIPVFSREHAISHILQFTHRAGFAISFFLI